MQGMTISRTEAVCREGLRSLPRRCIQQRGDCRHHVYPRKTCSTRCGQSYTFPGRKIR